MKEIASISGLPRFIPRKGIPIAIFILISALAIFGMIPLVSSGGSRAFTGLSPTGAFERYIESNNRFGTKFFKSLHASELNKNIVYSPLGVSSLFACLREWSEYRNELNRAFEWTDDQELGPAHRLLMARFIVPPAPVPEKERRKEAKKRYLESVADLGKAAPDFEWFYHDEEDLAAWRREDLWLTNSLQYHDKKIPKGFSKWFLEKAKENFGLKLEEVANGDEWKAAISRFPGCQPMLDSGASEGPFFILNSVARLGTKWIGDTFICNDPRPGEFHPDPGSTVPVTMLLSKDELFTYAKVDMFEAVILRAENADFIVILPSEGVSLRTLEAALAEDPGFFSPQLKERFGNVELPEFGFESEHYLRAQLEDIGVEEVFRDLGDLHQIPGSRLLGANQIASIKIDRIGIQAEAKTNLLGIEGGITEEDETFHMKVDRPFIFLVQDNLTGALFYMGAVTNPSRH